MSLSAQEFTLPQDEDNRFETIEDAMDVYLSQAPSWSRAVTLGVWINDQFMGDCLVDTLEFLKQPGNRELYVVDVRTALLWHDLNKGPAPR